MNIEQSIVINRPVEEVFDVATCLRRCVVWRSALLASKKTSDGPVGVGTTFDQDVRGLGKTYTNTAVITEYEPSRLFSFERVSGENDSDYQTRFTFEPEGEGTRFNVWVEGQPPSGWMRILPKSMLQNYVQNAIGREMEMLKEMLENEVDLEAALVAA